MRDADSEKDVTATFRCSEELRDRATEHPDLNQSEVFRTGTRTVMDGEEFAEAEHVNDRVFEALSVMESEYKAIEEDVSNYAPELAERLREARLSAVHEVTQNCRERVQCAESKVNARKSDPDAVSPGTAVSFTDAVDEVMKPKYDEKPTQYPVNPRVFRDGPANPMVEKWAKKCGMTPDTFWEKAKAKISQRTNFDFTSHHVEEHRREGLMIVPDASASESVATDGGGSP